MEGFKGSGLAAFPNSFIVNKNLSIDYLTFFAKSNIDLNAAPTPRKENIISSQGDVPKSLSSNHPRKMPTAIQASIVTLICKKNDNARENSFCCGLSLRDTTNPSKNNL